MNLLKLFTLLKPQVYSLYNGHRLKVSYVVKITILVSSGCYNSINLFFTILEAGKSKLKAPSESLSGENLLSDL